MTTKLVLGTVQFGLNYGITNSSGIPSDHEVKSILDLAENHGVEILDCALAYGSAHERLGRLNNHNFKMITKIPNRMPSTEIRNSLEEALLQSKVEKFYGVMFHSPEDLQSDDAAEKMAVLQDLKQLGLIEKIGVSVYNARVLDGLIEDWGIDITQLPLSLLDQRAINVIAAIKEKYPHVEIHSRSVFLQGAMLTNPDNLPEKLSYLKNCVKEYLQFCEQKSMDPGVAAMTLPIQAGVDGIVIGVTQKQELEQVVGWFEQAQESQFDIPYWDYHEQFDPRNW